MLRKVIKYTDFDGNEREEPFYFNLSKAEAIEMEMSTSGGLEKTIQKMIDTRDTKRIHELIKGLVLRAYGEKSADGKYFTKSKELSEAFSHTNAYSELMVELLAVDGQPAADFVNGITASLSK